MVIEAVHGLETTNMTMNARFSLLTAAPKPPKKIRQNAVVKEKSYNMKLLELMAQKLHQKDERSALQKRLDFEAYGLRHFGSEDNLSKPQNPHFVGNNGNLNQAHSQNRIYWRGSTGNLRRSASYNNLSQGGGPRRRRIWRGYNMRGRSRNNRQGVRRMKRVYQGFQRNRLQVARSQITARRGRGRGARNRVRKIPTKEELDAQLDQYMACTKTALDKELDAYMKNAAILG